MNFLQVKKRQESSLWIALPQDFATQLGYRHSFPVILQLHDASTKEPLGMVCWSGDISNNNTLEITECLFSIMELVEDHPVFVEVMQDITIANQIVVKCVNLEDYELMTCEQNFFEQQILNQGCLVVSYQFLPVWLRYQNAPVMLMPLEITPNASCAKMSVNTVFEILPPSTHTTPLSAAKTTEFSEPSEEVVSVPQDSGPWMFRLQRPPAALNLDRIYELMNGGGSNRKWGYENSELGDSSGRQSQDDPQISCSCVSCVFIYHKTGSELGLEQGVFVSFSHQKKPENEKNRRTLCLVFSAEINPGHCVVHDLVSSDLGLEYCQSVFISLVHPTVSPLQTPCSFQIQPVNLTAHPDQQDEKNKESGALYLRQNITGILGVDMFHHKEEKCRNHKHSAGNKEHKGLLSKAKHLLPFGSSTLTEDNTKEILIDNLKPGDRLNIFLKDVILSWMKLQVNISSKYQQDMQNKIHGEQQQQSCEQYYCFSPHQLVKLHLKGINHQASQEQDLCFRLEFNSDQNTSISAAHGVLLDVGKLKSTMQDHKFNLEVNEVGYGSLKSPENFPETMRVVQEPPWLSTVCKECMEYLRPALMKNKKKRNFASGRVFGVVISGGKQNGKTSLLKTIGWKLASDPEILAYVSYIPCKKLWPELVQSFSDFSKRKQQLFHVVSKAACQDPSIIILDDLDAWSLQDSSGESVNWIQERAVRMLRDLMDQTRMTDRAVVFLSSCTSLEKLDEDLLEPGFFDFHLTLPKFTSSVKTEILEHFFENKKLFIEQDALQDMNKWDSGMEVNDLERLAQRAIHSHCQKKERTPPVITKEDISKALENFQSSSRWKLPKKSGMEDKMSCLEDVGGMQEVKEVFKDCIELPLKFPRLISQCPLRLMTNILLYGPPGSGKTFIVHSLSHSLDIRLKVVKGPELLNKYIGQSEAAVRSTFKSAMESSPCLLFFDEFEALGRHRGTDTSGIADRIVNQLLAEMDGVETLTGICIIAATSRPDLIDKALLRPGRLDRHVFCPLPDQQERHEILKNTASKQVLKPEVDLVRMAAQTEGYTGADLASIISEAHLHAIGKVLKSQEERKTQEKIEIEISKEDVEFALERSRPSSSPKEKEFLSQIYSNFSNGKVCISRDSPYFREKGLTYG